MNNLELKEFGTIISSETIGKDIYDLIKKTINNNEEVIIDMTGIKSMATFCAKQIFGKLYIELGAEKFYNLISIKNATDDIKTIIQIGIENALEEHEEAK
ncbi:MAG: STAS-like domain-containing protein [Raineya sp.]|nr:STAS-like domain-containing protein [Raineya sp.]